MGPMFEYVHHLRLLMLYFNLGRKFVLNSQQTHMKSRTSSNKVEWQKNMTLIAVIILRKEKKKNS